MNDRIRKLAEQAANYADKNATEEWADYPGRYYEVFQEQFAQLVIEECVAQINSAKLETFANESHITQMLHNKIQLVEQIRQHFGVEL